MKKSLWIGLLVCVELAYATNPESPTVPQSSSLDNPPAACVSSMLNDAYLQEFVNQKNSERVQFRKGCLLLFADVAMLRVILEASGAVLCGVGAKYFLSYHPNSPQESIYKVIDIGFLGICAAWLTFCACEDIENFLSSTPYIVLSERGVYVWGERICIWKELGDIVLKKQNEVNELYTVDLNDKYGKNIAVFDHDLPIEITVFAKLVAYYKDCVLKNEALASASTDVQ